MNKNTSPDKELLKLFFKMFTKISPQDMEDIYIKKNIKPEKFAVYHQFLEDLLKCVYDTFLGNDIIYSQHDIETHYNWCYKKVADSFHSQRYRFEENQELQIYFLAYLRDNLYLCEESIEKDLNYFNSFFNFNKSKTKIELINFLDLYQLFDKTPVKGRFLVEKQINKKWR